MMWMDYIIESIPAGKGFKIKGEWEGEVMGVGPDGKPKDNWLYKPGDVFVVNESGWLMKTDEVNALLLKYKSKDEV